jgi:hypothetical protein
MPLSFAFEDLSEADLKIDAIYEGGNQGNMQAEPLSKLLGVGNQGGIRFLGRGKHKKLVVLTSNQREIAWPDKFDPLSGELVYFGDNREPGEPLKKPGNRVLKTTFDSLAGGNRQDIPIYFYFSKMSDGKGYDTKFKGLLVPGRTGDYDDFFQGVWRTSADGQNRFENFRALFTVLKVREITRAWLEDIKVGRAYESTHAPEPYKQWVANNKYSALTAPRVASIRTRNEQLPDDERQMDLLVHLYKQFPQERAYEFESVALKIWGLISKNKVEADITRPAVDGGRDAVGWMGVGPAEDLLKLDFNLEAKCYAPDSAVGVRETSRLISRLRRHHFGVLVTTSYIAPQAYKEIKEDNHPVVLICGKDIVDVLNSVGVVTPQQLDKWLETIE